MKIHDLKLNNKYYRDVAIGVKNFEIRYNDRDYQVGDMLKLQEWDGEKFTGKYCYRMVTYILPCEEFDDWKNLKGYVVMSIE